MFIFQWCYNATMFSLALYLYYYLIIIYTRYVIRSFQTAVKMNQLHIAQSKYFKIWYFLLLFSFPMQTITMVYLVYWKQAQIWLKRFERSFNNSNICQMHRFFSKCLHRDWTSCNLMSLRRRAIRSPLLPEGNLGQRGVGLRTCRENLLSSNS